MIEAKFDPRADVLHVKFEPPGAVYDAAEYVSPGISLIYDTAGRVIGVEIESVARRLAGIYTTPADEKAAAE
jgi:uncharacterized protein YuzE